MIATPLEEDRATATGHLHNKFHEDRSSGSTDMLADRQTDRQADRNTTLPYWGRVIIYKLENVAINDVLPLKASRRDAIANFKCFGASDTRDLVSMVTFTFAMRRHLICLASAPFISSRLATFG